MSNGHIEDVKHEAQRGMMLFILIGYRLDWVPYIQLRIQMGRLGYPMDDDVLSFQINYCEAGGYIEKKSLRSGKYELNLLVIRATKKAVDLRDGRIEPDQGIAF